MYDQPKHKPEDRSAFYADGASARPLVPGTVARATAPQDLSGQGGLATATATGANGFPVGFPTGGEALRRRVDRGQERFTIYYSVCHGYDGRGDGMIVQRGFTPPPAFVLVPEDERRNPARYDREKYLQTAPPQHIYDAITNGFGAMYSYAERVSPDDRWNVALYVKVLQQQATAPMPATATATKERVGSRVE